MISNICSTRWERPSRRLVSTYFDTEGGILRRHRVALRVRRSPGGLVQTLKRTGASIVGREEWEQANALPEPDLDWLCKTPLKTLFSKTVARALAARFMVDVHRALFTTSHDGADIEAAFDRGAILANGRSLAVHGGW